MPGTRCSSSPSTMWQVLVPMIITMRPASVTVAAGTDTCASTLAIATAVPGFSPVQPAAWAVSPPALSPMGWISRRHFFVDDVLQARVERLEILVWSGSLRAWTTWLCNRRCTSCASPRRSAARPPSRRLRSGGRPPGRPPAPHPGFAASWRRTIPRRSCRRSGPARLRSIAASGRVDLVGLRLGGVMLPQLDPGVRVRAELGQVAQRRAIRFDRQHGAGGEIDPHADHIRRVHPTLSAPPGRCSGNVRR